MWEEQGPIGDSESLQAAQAAYEDALDAMRKSKENAVAADKALFDAINRELSWVPQPIPGPTGLASLWTFGRNRPDPAARAAADDR
jgi:hypothetical protein